MEKTVNTATQGAEQPAPRLHLSTFNELLDVSKFPIKTDEDGEPYTDRPNVEVFATLSHETEDYIRIIKTLSDMLPIYAECLRGTYYGGEQANARYKVVLPLIQKLREEIGHDLGVCIADRLAEWGEDYI
ncbi:MAG: hypothetical protein II284_03095 [Clostridia bacterium]|jgi:hypothetical protein|nr:hypothetical protein [Clostridia bacterium]MBQ5900408.1 hypothetical protein [Clostridia bacterium]